MNRTPPSYRRATWRCTLPHDPVEGVIGIGINVDGGVERYALDTQSAHALVQTLADFLGYEIKSPAGTQSPTSPLMEAIGEAVELAQRAADSMGANHRCSAKKTRTLPQHHYEPVEFRGFAPSCDLTKQVGLSFNRADGTVLRLRLSARDADRLQWVLVDDQVDRTGDQSAMSSGRPSVDVSVVPGQSQ